MPTRPLLEITSGYAKRAASLLPHQGTEGPWRTSMEYRADRKMLREGPVDDDNLCFATSSPADALEPALAG
jgi:monooxygenase